ncbi:PAS domain S-box protein [Planctomycetota bacterium]
MKIRQKLILGFVGIASLVGVAGIMCVNTSQRALQKSIGESSVALAVETMDKIDRNIYYTIEEFQAYCSDLILQETVAKSNQEFEKLENPQKYIDEKNNEWISAQKVTTPLMQELLNNELSEELREKIGFHEEKHEYKVFGEVFVTNKYGANVALTKKTADYRQDDELWWEKAREDGLYVSDVEYDESAGIHSTAIAIRSNDKEGNFNGVVKVVLNIEETIDIIRKTKEVVRYNSAEFKLLDRNGKTIFDQSGEFKFFEDKSNSEFFKKLAGDRGYLRKKAEDENEGKIELMAFARSQGHHDYKGLGWILTIEYQTAELFAPVVKLRNIILSISLVLTILAVIPGILISNYISRPLSKLKAAMDKIGKGDMSIHVDIKRNDEIGQLANAFNHMVEYRKQAEEALRISEGKLGAMLRAITDDIAVIDNDLNIIWTNDAAREIFGNDILGRKCYEVYHQRNKPCEPYPCPTIQAFQDGNIHQYETQITNKEGKSRHIHCIANVALRDGNGKPTGVLEICRDITERKRMEEALRESEEKYKNLFEQMSSGVAVYEAIDNGNDFVIKDFNQTAENIEHLDREDIVGKRVTDVFPGINEFGLINVFKQVWETGKTEYFPDALYMDKSGHRGWRENWIYRLPTGEVVAVYNDITERKQTEEALQESERKYSKLVQQSPDAVISLDKLGYFLSFNPAAEHVSGFSAQEVIGRHFSKVGILDKKSIAIALKEFGLTLAGAERQPFDLIITRKDKSHVHMEANGSLIKQKGEKTWIQVTLRDITERKLAEERLEKINTCLLSLGSDFTENANIITALLGDILGATCALYNRLDNDMLCSLALWQTPPDYNPQDKPDGHICHDVIQRGTNEVCAIRDLQNSPYAQSDPNVLAYGLQSYVGQAVMCNGRHVGSLCAVFQKDFKPSEDEKKIIGILASAMRVEEERRQAKEELRQSQKAAEQALQTGELILDTMPVGVIVVDKDKTIRRVNKTALMMMGCDSPQEIIGHTCHNKICPAEVDNCPVIDLGNSVDNSEKVLLNREGRNIPILKTVLPITLEGEEVLLEAFVDITDRRQAEQELEKLNKDLESAVWELRRANKELQEFAYITAHDLKTPLRGIGTLADWLSTDYADKFDEQGKKQVTLLVEKAKQMSALIDGIMQYSKLGHTSPQKRQVDLNTLLSDIIDGIEPPENIEITIENDLPTLICDKTQIMQVFQNLLSNAVKYMDKPEGQIKVGCVEQDGFWKFSIADNGPGIDEKYLKKIFKIFQMLSPQSRADSTGIGLSIVKKIVELNAGIVWVESELGQGSTFFFTVPKSGICQEVPAGSTAEYA